MLQHPAVITEKPRVMGTVDANLNSRSHPLTSPERRARAVVEGRMFAGAAVGDELSQPKLLDAVDVIIAHVDVALCVHRYAGR